MADAVQIVKLDTNGDGQLSKEELLAGPARLKEKASEALEIKFDEQLVNPNEIRCEFDDGQNATVYLKFPAKAYSKLVIRSRWMAVLPPGHRQFLTLKTANGRVAAERLLAANMDTVTVEPETTAATGTTNQSSFADFLLMGVKHIWTGYDHLLFLFGLLIVTRNFASSVKIEYADKILLGEVVYCRQEQAGWLLGIRLERALSGVTDLDDAIRRSR